MNGLLKKIGLSLFSIGLVAATFFLDQRLDAASALQAPQEVEIIEQGSGAIFEADTSGFILRNETENTFSLRVRRNAVFRFAPGTVAHFALLNEADNIAMLNFEHGRVWVNTFNSSLRTNLVTSNLSIDADPGVFDVAYEDGQLKAKAHRHSLKISFLEKQLVLPEHREITITESKIENAASTISQLRSSKLFKEFPYFVLGPDDELTALNKQNDEAFEKRVRSDNEQAIREHGPRLPGDDSSLFFNAAELWSSAKLTLTFDPQKKTEIAIASALDYFDSAVYAFFVGKADIGAIRLQEFKKRALELRNEPKFEETISSRLNYISFADSGDSLFPARSLARSFKDTSAPASLHSSFNDVLDSETDGRVRANLRKFGALAASKVPAIKDQSFSTEVLLSYVLFNDFLNRNQFLLREEFLKISELFERKRLDLVAGKEEADDERQFFIAEKLKKIAVLQGLMKSEAMPFQDARNSILLIARQIDALTPSNSDAAVLSYFESQLKDYAPLIAFLRSIDAENVHGSFEDSFTDFSMRTDELKKVTELLATARGGTQISPFRREELAGVVSNELGAIGVSKIKIVLPENEEDIRVKIMSAQLEGKQFTGVFDTARKVISDLVIGGEQIPNAVRLENLQKFFLIKAGKLVLPTGISADSLTEQPSQASLLERVSKEKLLEEFGKLGVTVEDKYLGFENLGAGVIHVRLALLGIGVDAKVFSFTVDDKVTSVSDLKVQTVAGEIPVNDSFSLRELPTRVEQIYARAVFDKQKEEELKKLDGGTRNQGQ